jgi:hypothetical protein
MSYLLNYKGWRTLHESQEFKKLYESGGAAYVREMSEVEKQAVDLLKNQDTAASFEGFGTIRSFLVNQKILFNISADEAANWILLGYIRLYAGAGWIRQSKIDGNWIEKVKKDKAKWGTVVNQIDERIRTELGATVEPEWKEFQFNQSQTNPKNINTVGKITTSGIDSTVGGAPSDSNLEEICRYVNTYNLVNNVVISWDTSTGYEYGSPEIIKDKTSKVNGYLDFKNGSFIDNSAGKSSVMKNLASYQNGSSADEIDVYFWSLGDYTPPTSKTTSSTTAPEIIKQVGDVIEPLPIDAGYQSLYYKPSAEALNKLLETLNKVKKVGEIVELTVYGSASTEAINMGTANQGQALINYWKEKGQPGADKFVPATAGLNGIKLPADKVINGSGVAGIVTDPMASGNAFLAKLRCDEIANFLSANRFTPAKKVYQITQGAEDARFIKVSFKVKKPDSATTLDPITVLKTVGSVGGTKDYAAIFKCRVADIDLF